MSTYITPRWARVLVGKLSNRKQHDIVVRARTAAVVYLIIGLSIGATVGSVFL